MKLFEVYQEEAEGYQDIGNDKSVEFSTRKTRLTLKQINKLRKMNDVRKYEKEKDLVNIQAQYGPQPEAGGEDLGL